MNRRDFLAITPASVTFLFAVKAPKNDDLKEVEFAVRGMT